jgi:serine/threonine protein kinase
VGRSHRLSLTLLLYRLKIGKYEIVRKLGRGGMADVYLAQDGENGGTVALKLIEHATDADTIAAIEAERRGAELQAPPGGHRSARGRASTARATPTASSLSPWSTSTGRIWRS